MNQLVGHLRPEPYPGLLHPHSSLSKPRQSSAGQGGQRQFPFFSLLSALSGSQEPKGHTAWGSGGGGSKDSWVEISQVNKEANTDRPTLPTTF